MTRKFKTEPASYYSLISTLDRAQCEMPVTVERQYKRAERLLTNWALWGHSPVRNVTTCRECEGRGESMGGFRCRACKGTGKAVKL